MSNNRSKRTKESIKRIIKYIYNISSLDFIIILAFTILTGFTSAMSIWATKILINGIVESSTGKGNNFLSTLFIYALINILILLIQSISNYVNSKHQLKIDYNMSMDILEKCEKLELQDFENSEIYNILARAEMEGKFKVYTTYKNILSVIIQISSIVSIATIILSWNSYIFLLIFITPIISTIINTKIGYKNYKMRMGRINEERKTTYISYLLTNDIACKEVKVYNIGSYLTSMFSDIKRKIQNQDLNITKIRTLWLLGLSLIEELISLFIIFKVVAMAVIGKILVGDTVSYIDSLSTIQSNIGGFLNSISEIYNDILYVEEFYKLLDLEIERDNSETIEIEEIKEIEFKNVYYKYEGSSSFIISNINVKIKKGELIGIVGENGSGKTTFIKLLCGFYDNYEGEILINGIELRKINLESLRQRMGIIFQDFNKYEMTLRENIGFGNIKELYNDEKIIQILEEIKLRNKVDMFSKKIDTQMGRWFEGEELSKGQWQRIAIGRAFIKDADIYILDEPTASLDPITEKEVFSLVNQRSKNKIGIFITHRVENIAILNPRVIVFSKGEIIGDNSHERLMNTCEEYIQLLGIQKQYS